MSRLRRSLVVPAIIALALTAPSQASPDPAADPNALAAALVHAPMAEQATADACSVRVELPDTPAVEDACPRAADAGASSSLDAQLEASAEVHTARWFADLAPANDGRVARVHGYGDVALHRPDGEVAWARSGMSFFHEWGVDPWIVPIVPMGASPLDPFVIASERPFAVGDLTGDGTDDIAISHFVRTLNPDGTTTSARSFVTVVDGTDGDTLWHRRYPGYVTQLLVDGGALFVGNETGNVKSSETLGENGSTSSVRRLSFAMDDDALTITGETLVLDTGAGWARLLAIEPAGDGVAIAYTSKALGASGSGGRVRYAGGGDPGPIWDVATTGYPRALRYDAGRQRVIVHEQADPLGDTNRRQSYWITGLTLESGTIAARISRSGAVLVSFEIGDVAGGLELEWLTGDLQQLPQTPSGAASGTYQAMRVMAADGASPSTLWTHSVQMPSEFANGRGGGLASWPVPYAIAVVDRSVAVATWHSVGVDALSVLEGGTGAMRWERYGDAAYPIFLQPAEIGSRHAVMGVTMNKVVRAYAMSDGEVLRDVPLLADTYEALAYDANTDGAADLLVGGESGAVFALDGTALRDDPGVLWRTTVGTGVRRLELGDLDADGDDELIVAATSAVVVLDPQSGEVLWTRSIPGNYHWTFTLGELDGEPGLDLVVPEHNLWALRGHDGVTLWDHVPDPKHYFSNAAVTPDGMVVAQAVVEFPSPLAPRHHRILVGLDAASGEMTWRRPYTNQFANGRLWYSLTEAGPTADGQGTRVASTWEPGGGPAGSLDAGIVTDVVDSRTGEVLVTHPGEAQGVVPMQTTYEPGRGLFEVNWKTVQQLEPQNTEVVWEATSDIAWGDFGEKGEGFVRAWHRVWLHESDAPTGGQGSDHPAPIAEYGDLYLGTVSVDDLDGDGADEIIGTVFDWPGYARVAGWAGISVSAADLLPHGLAVLEVV